jgi:hypothetical protein
MRSHPIFLFLIKLLFITILVSACNAGLPLKFTANTQIQSVYTLQAEGDRTIVRAITKATTCPTIVFDHQAPIGMNARVNPEVIADRADNGQTVTKEANFDVLTCEINWQQGAQTARVGSWAVAAPRPINRIVLVSDTGCRMKASDNGFQNCNDPKAWPFAQVAQSAAVLKPDLVIHLGDINYRESPCPESNAGCANSPWGYGYDTWQADLFAPARPLLAVAPWLFVRGNHESCLRAGQGWFRFLDIQPWSETRSCNSATHDLAADYSEPYAVKIASNLNFILFDSSRAPAKALSPKEVAFEKYAAEMQQVTQLAQQQTHNFFLSHHPVLGFGLPEKGDKINTASPGNLALQSVFKSTEPQRLLPSAIDLTLSGHVHLFEAIGFSSPHPVALVMGNSGSLNEGHLPDSIPAGVEPYPGAVVDNFVTLADFGFATLDRVDPTNASLWTLTEYKADGTPVYRCDINGNKSRCKHF